MQITLNIKIYATIVIMVVLLVIENVYCYSLSGMRWKKPPYPHLWYINYCQDIDDYFATLDAANDWNNINLPLGVRPVFHNYWYPPNHILVTNVVNPSALWDGICYRYDYNGDNYIDYVEIYLNNYFTQNYPYNAIRSVIAHEFGHSLGLTDVSAPVLMNGYTSVRYFTYGIFTPTQDEVNGINYLYGG
ncbi:MAG: matrixin family metalloprotease [Candidatus Bathyarchaeia archaeon]